VYVCSNAPPEDLRTGVSFASSFFPFTKGAEQIPPGRAPDGDDGEPFLKPAAVQPGFLLEAGQPHPQPHPPPGGTFASQQWRGIRSKPLYFLFWILILVFPRAFVLPPPRTAVPPPSLPIGSKLAGRKIPCTCRFLEVRPAPLAIEPDGTFHTHLGPLGKRGRKGGAPGPGWEVLDQTPAPGLTRKPARSPRSPPSPPRTPRTPRSQTPPPLLWKP